MDPGSDAGKHTICHAGRAKRDPASSHGVTLAFVAGPRVRRGATRV